MRVSERQRYETANDRIEGAKNSNVKAMETLSSQRRINKVSDDPIGLSKVIRGRERISEMQQLQKNVTFAQGFLERTESAISGIHEKLIRAKELAVGQASDTFAADSREAVSREVGQMVKEVVSLANTSFSNRYVFSGFRTQTPSLDPDHGFLGDDGAIFLQTDDKTFLQVNVQARSLFEPTLEERDAKHSSMIDTLNSFYMAHKSNDKFTIRKCLDELDFHLNKTSSYMAVVGARSKSLEDASGRLQLDSDLTAEQVSRIQDADSFQASSEFKRSEGILQSTLLVSNKMLQPSLLNFMQ